MNHQRKMKKRVKNSNKINALQKQVNRSSTKHKQFKSVTSRLLKLKKFVSLSLKKFLFRTLRRSKKVIKMPKKVKLKLIRTKLLIEPF